MVEEHSTNLNSRIDPEYPSSIPAPILSPSCQKADLKLTERADSASVTTVADKPDSSLVTSQPANAEQKEASCDLDVKSAIDHKKDSFKTSRPNSIESKRSKSLGNASSADSAEDSKCKKDVKKTKSNPVKIENVAQDTSADNVVEIKEVGMTAEESVSPGRNASSETKFPERNESPKPGCSNQQDLGKYVYTLHIFDRRHFFLKHCSTARHLFVFNKQWVCEATNSKKFSVPLFLSNPLIFSVQIIYCIYPRKRFFLSFIEELLTFEFGNRYDDRASD